MYDTYTFILRMLALLTSLYLGDVLTLAFNQSNQIALQELDPTYWFSCYLIVAMGGAGVCGSCFALEVSFCFLMLLFGDYPLICCTLLALFSFFFRMLIAANWSVGSNEFLIPLWTVEFLPFFGIFILLYLLFLKRSKQRDRRQIVQR